MPLEQQILERLTAAARAAATKAYCPYSRFRVGAAVLGHGGEIFAGCNVENASYGLSMCAERNAVFQAVSAGITTLLAVVIYTPTPVPTAPCGACRQVMQEFGPCLEVVSVCDGPAVLRRSLTELLPGAFTRDSL